MRRRLRKFLPIVLIAVMVQILAPVAACWAASIAASDPLVRKKAAEEYAKEYQKTATAAAAIVPLGALPPTPLVVPQAIRDSYYAKIAEEHFSPFAGVIPAEALPPNDPRRGTPWIRSDIKDQVKLSQGVGVRPPLPPAVKPILARLDRTSEVFAPPESTPLTRICRPRALTRRHFCRHV